MNILKKIIITDTNILTDLHNADILDKFVTIDNIYISDLVKNYEINSNTGNIKLINKIKSIPLDEKQIEEIAILFNEHKKLSPQDISNYVLARDNDAILATGDNRLKIFSEDNNIEVIRTLKIIELMKDNSIISIKDAVNACLLLTKNSSTRIPIEDIDKFIEKLEKDSINC